VNHHLKKITVKFIGLGGGEREIATVIGRGGGEKNTCPPRKMSGAKKAVLQNETGKGERVASDCSLAWGSARMGPEKNRYRKRRK